MVRSYKRKPGARRYRDFTKTQLKAAIRDVTDGMALRKAEEKHGVPRSSIRRARWLEHRQHPGHPTALTEVEEKEVVRLAVVTAQWGYPLDKGDIKLLIQTYLNKEGRTISMFKNNLPGDEWCRSFLLRHTELSTRKCSNVKRSRGEVSREHINEFFTEFGEVLEGVEPGNLINYDESNICDDPGAATVITKKGVKRVSRILDATKQSTSFMMTAAADGTTLPLYVVYKATNLYDSWCKGGPPNCHYNRTKSGWFDATTFQDWFEKVPLPYFQQREGKKVMVGDNLSSHLSAKVIEMCEENDINFVFLPPNSTHLLQPLDVAVFRPLKRMWKKILLEKKEKKKGTGVALPKDKIPEALKELMLGMQPTMATNIKSGFKKAGMIPVNPAEVLSEIPQEEPSTATEELENSLVLYLKKKRFSDENMTERRKKKKLKVVPGKSVTSADLESSDEEDTQGLEEEMKRVMDEDSDLELDAEESSDEEDKENWKGIQPFTKDHREGSFVLVKTPTTKKPLFEVGKTLGQSAAGRNKLDVKMMRSYKMSATDFVWLENPDIRTLTSMSIVGSISNPTTTRYGVLKFAVNKKQWNQ